ncbi:MAG: class I SAM-dependent methyltransferase [Candidatus Omnitrophica bacterium]|nr:class I SAM-dependent methyltransferase [Candidatus Omnitrophota bacterium]
MQPAAYALNYEHEESHWWFLARREIIVSILHALMVAETRSGAPRLSILDYGCGTGGLTLALAPFGEVTGVDESGQAIAWCHKRGMNNVRRIVTPQELPSGAYDWITCFDVLEHVEDDGNLLREFRRVLKPGGRLLLTVPALPILWGGEDEVSRHVRRYTKRNLLHKLQAAGFEVHKISYFNTLLFPAVLTLRLFNRWFRPSSWKESDLKSANPLLNSLLYRIFALERHVLRYGSLPIGVSLLAVGKSSTWP